MFEITPDFLDHERIYKLTEVGLVGWSGQTTSFQIRSKPVEDYKGYYVARTMTLSWAGSSQPNFYICKVGDKFDGRFSLHHTKAPSPWLGDVPTLAEVENYFQPLDEAGVVEEFLQLFEAVEREALANHVVTVEDREKRDALKPFDVKLSDLRSFFGLVISDEAEFLEQFCVDACKAANQPFQFLNDIEIVNELGLKDCRSFHWNHLIAGSSIVDDYKNLSELSYCTSLDWKADKEDLEWGLERVAKKVAPDTGLSFDLPDFIYESDTYQHEFNTYDWFVLADEQAATQGYRLIFWGVSGDNYNFTFVKSGDLEEFLRLGSLIEAGVEAIDDDHALPQELRPYTKRTNFWGDELNKGQSGLAKSVEQTTKDNLTKKPWWKRIFG